MKYAIKVPFDRHGTMLYVVDAKPHHFGANFMNPPVLFETEEEASAHAKVWGDKAIVVEYKEEE
jgi:hypothetical protein